MRVLASIVLIAGVATTYGGAGEDHHHGAPLYCDRGDNDLRFDEELEPWVALDVSEYEMGRVRCGDEMVLQFEDGQTLVARAFDAGYLYRYTTEIGGPIVADVPAFLAPFRGLAQVQVGNRSAVQRAWEQFR